MPENVKEVDIKIDEKEVEIEKNPLVFARWFLEKYP